MKLLHFTLLIFLAIGCTPKGDASYDSTGSIEKESVSQEIKNDERKLIKEANLRFRTANIQETHSFICANLKGYGAYISEENTFNYSSETGHDLTIRVPAEKFDSLLNFIVSNAKIEELDNKSTQIKDVTEDFIDVQARLKIKKDTEKKLTSMLMQAKNLTETLEIQNQLTELRSDIESVEGRLKYLNDQVKYSTINVSFYENIKYSKRFFGDFWDALKNGWQVFLHFVTLLAYLWVVILAFFLVRWGYKYYKKIKNERN